MFSNNLIAGVSGQGGGGYAIDDSLRFNDNDSAYLSRTPSVAGNRRTFTFSAWVKRGNLGLAQNIFQQRVDSDNSQQFSIQFRSDDIIRVIDQSGGTTQGLYDTIAVYRDLSGWYHIVVSCDTTNATAGDRVKLYVNGERVTNFNSPDNWPLNYDTSVNNTVRALIGAQRPNVGSTLSSYLDGYMAEVNLIDGQALTPDDFGEINEDTGEWSAKKYSGTYGTNGFYLQFKDGSALGDDTSGNTNDWTPTNLASTDQMLDTPTNNFATMNVLTTTITLSEGNLKQTTNVISNWQSAISTIGVSSGKWYFETCSPTVLNDPPNVFIGITTDPNLGIKSSNNYLGNSADSWGYLNDARKFTNGSSTSYGTAYTNGDVIGCALDMDSGTVTFYKNNVSQGVAYTGLTGTMFCGASSYTTSGTTSNNINFGQDSSFAGLKTRQGNTDANGIGDFYYAPPTGYLALCTDNLPEPAIVDSESHFNVVTYTGNGGTQSITGLGFQPDFTWVKVRSTANDHTLQNVISGNDKFLRSNTADAEGTNSEMVSSFDSDGFTLGPNALANQSGQTYVAWCWKAGGTAVTNTDGAITSQVSANVDAGVSVATYTGNSSTGTIGHGLSKKPEFVIIKNRTWTGSSAWFVGSPSFGTNNYLQLNSTSAMLNYLDGSGGSFFNYGGWSDSVVNVYNANSTSINSSSYNYVMYSFHSVEGFSKFGSYVGNGSADGPFVYTGFRPAFVLYKRAIGGTGNWTLSDNKREGYNGDNPALYPNLSNAEAISGTSIDLLSNGFKILNPNTDHNASGSTYIYMAFAEAPLKNSLGR